MTLLAAHRLSAPLLAPHCEHRTVTAKKQLQAFHRSLCHVCLSLPKSQTHVPQQCSETACVLAPLRHANTSKMQIVLLPAESCPAASMLWTSRSVSKYLTATSAQQMLSLGLLALLDLLLILQCPNLQASSVRGCMHMCISFAHTDRARNVLLSATLEIAPPCHTPAKLLLAHAGHLPIH